MGRMLGFMLFPREGAAGGAWSFLLSPVSAAVADLPLALFVFRSPVAPASLLLPVVACLSLTLLTGASFDRERLMESGLVRRLSRRWWSLPVGAVRRNAAALAVGLILAAVPACGGALVAAGGHFHNWPEVRGAVTGQALEPERSAAGAGAAVAPAAPSGTQVAAAGLAGLTAALALAALLLALNFAAFFLLGLPEVVGLAVAATLWGIQAGFGTRAPLAAWLAGAGGVALLALTLNTAAGLPIYEALAFGAGRRLDRVRSAWGDYFLIFRTLVLPVCGAFGIVVVALLLK
jgi:hypothetical protein